MIAKIKRWLEPPRFQGDEDKTDQTRIANTLILYLGGALVIVNLVLIPLFAYQKIGSWMIAVTMLCALGIGRHLIFQGRFQLGGGLIFSFIYLCILAMLIFSGEASGTAMFYFATVVLIAGFFLDVRLVNGLTLATFLIAMGISFLQELGLVDIPQVFGSNSFFSWVATGIGLVFMIRTRELFVGNLQNAVATARQQNAEIQKAEARFRAVVEHSSNGVVFMSADRKINYISPSYRQLLGFTPEEMLGRFGAEYIYPPDRELAANKFSELLQTPGGTVVVEYRLQRKDGSYCWIETTAANLLDNPNVRSVVLNQRDINERKHAEIHNRLIAEVQDFLLRPCELQDIYHLVSEKTQELIGDGITATAILDETRNTLRMGAYHGVDIPFEKVLSIIGFDPWQKEFTLDAMADEGLSVYRNSRLGLLNGGLYALMTQVIPQPACLLIEKLLGVQKIYGMGFVHKNAHLGGLVILARSDITPHIATIEQMANLATIAIERKLALDELTASEERFREVLENSLDAAYKRNLKTNKYEYLSPVFERILGYTREEFANFPLETILTLMHPDDHALSEIEIAESLSLGEGMFNKWDYRLKHKDGQYRWLQDQCILVRDEQGQPAAWIGSVSDITERKHAEETLLKFKFGIERSADAVFMTDPQGVIVYANPSFEKIYGYAPDQVIGQTPRILKSGLVPPENYRHFWATLRNKGVVAGEIINKTKDGQLITIEGSNNPILDAAGNIIGFLGIHRDITERKKADEALRASQSFLSDLIENSGALIYVKDHAGKYELVNRKWEETTGKPRAHVIGQTDEDLFPGEAGRNFRQADLQVMAYGDVLEKEEELEGATGKRFFISIKFPLRDHDGAIKGLCGISTDITERKRAEQMIRDSETKFRSLIEQSSEGVVLIDEQNKVIEWNPAQERITGIPRAEVIGAMYWDIQYRILPPERQAQRSPEYFKNAMLASMVNGRLPGTMGSVEVVIQTPTGERKSILQTSFPIQTETGYRIGAVVRDITERKRGEQALLENEAKFRTAFMTSLDGFYVATLEEGLIIEVNHVFEKIFGYPRDQVIGKTARQLNLYYDFADRAKIVAELRATGFIKDYELKERRKNGEIIICSLSASLMQINNQSLILGAIRDITERKKTEGKIQQQLQELQRWYDVTIERETRAVELKREVNELLRRLNEPPRYASTDLAE